MWPRFNQFCPAIEPIPFFVEPPDEFLLVVVAGSVSEFGNKLAGGDNGGTAGWEWEAILQSNKKQQKTFLDKKRVIIGFRETKRCPKSVFQIQILSKNVSGQQNCDIKKRFCSKIIVQKCFCTFKHCRNVSVRNNFLFFWTQNIV